MDFGQLFTAFVGFAVAWILAYPTYNWFWGQKKVSLYKSIIESYRYEVDVLNDHYEKLRLEKAEQDRQFYELQTQNESLSASLEKRQTLLIEHENKLKKFSSQSGEVEGKAEGLRQEVFRKTEQIDVLHRQVQQKTAQLQQYEHELEHQKSLVAQLQLKSGNAANSPILTEKNKQIANLHTQLSVLLPLESKVLKQTNEINELRVQKQRLQEVLYEKNKNLDKLKADCETCNEKTSQVNEEIEQIGALISENASIRNENDKYAEKLKLLETHLEELKKQPMRIEPNMVESVQSANEGENDLTTQTIDNNNDMARKKIIKQEIITEKEEIILPKTEAKTKKTAKSSDKETSAKIENVSSDEFIVENLKEKSIKKSDAKKAAKIDDYEIEETESKKKKTIETAKTGKEVELKNTKAEPETEVLIKKETKEIKAEVETAELDEEAKKRETPIFKALAEPKLPELDKENRLFLQMQSPTRIFFYWTVKTNAYKTLQKAFGENAGGYILVAKLQNLSKKTEDIFPIDVEGSAWFDVPDNAKFQTEVGFFSPSRPFVRVAFSNTLKTPRMSPSPNVDNSPGWNVSTMQFAEVLEASGYSQDAFEVAMQVSESSEDSNKATEVIYSRITGENEAYFAKFEMSELRSVLLGIVSGIPLAVILEKVSGELSAWLSENPQVFEPQNVMAILQETFGEDFGKFVEGTKTQTAGVVFGASSINFPKSRFAGSSR
jgi:hypothetical protein